ncbi:MAG: galactose mutarotase [Pirellulaceae bacterium]|nr:galactose mutarotase [Pirellulaceae bacterium]
MMTDLQRESFGRTKDGQAVERYTLRVPNGLTARFISFGATLTELLVPDRDGRVADVVLGFDDLTSYESTSPYFGSTVGRVAFRIPFGQFVLGGRTYQLDRNSGDHHLHGGAGGFSWRVWHAEPVSRDDGPAIRFSLRSPDGDQGYPGQVDAAVEYGLTRDGALRIVHSATTDQPTPLNMTHHSYFNLAGAGFCDVLQHELQIDAERFSETDADTIPTGKLLPVAGTPLDFRQPERIGLRIGTADGQVDGYDLAYLLRTEAGRLRQVATLRDPASGRVMDVLTDAPALVLYTGNELNGSLQGKHGVFYGKQYGMCLETGGLPAAVHHAHFPPILLKPGQTYRHTCVYRFRS